MFKYKTAVMGNSYLTQAPKFWINIPQEDINEQKNLNLF